LHFIIPRYRRTPERVEGAHALQRDQDLARNPFRRVNSMNDEIRLRRIRIEFNAQELRCAANRVAVHTSSNWQTKLWTPAVKRASFSTSCAVS
jgi:hypothetical protein